MRNQKIGRCNKHLLIFFAFFFIIEITEFNSRQQDNQ